MKPITLTLTEMEAAALSFELQVMIKFLEQQYAEDKDNMTLAHLKDMREIDRKLSKLLG